MDLPRRYPYDPSWRLILLLLFVGIVAPIVLVAMHKFSVRVGAGLAAIFDAVALLLIVRRLAFRRFVELGLDGLMVPTGFLRARAARISYSDITRVSEGFLPLTAILIIATSRRRVEILSSLLPDAESYVALRNFLFQYAPKENALAQPSGLDRWLGLMLMVGFMLVISALPVGVVLSLHDYKANRDWQWAIILGVAMAGAAAVVGSLLLSVSVLIGKRQAKNQERPGVIAEHGP
jgi:hypothetical protein